MIVKGYSSFYRGKVVISWRNREKVNTIFGNKRIYSQTFKINPWKREAKPNFKAGRQRQRRKKCGY